jgi:hypothetical protein
VFGYGSTCNGPEALPVEVPVNGLLDGSDSYPGDVVDGDLDEAQ